MSQLEVDKVIPQSGTTLTLGDSADTITIPSGATLDASSATLTLPDGSVTSAKISYPLTTFSSTGIDDNATSTAITINSSNNVALTGNIGLGGATPTTSGTGITFPATASASTNANTLDDYEEGNFGGNSANDLFVPGTSGTITMGRGNMAYTKIGRICNIRGEINVSSVASPVGGTTINLPFTSATSSVDRNAWGAARILTYNVAHTGTGLNIIVSVDGGTTGSFIFEQSGGTFAAYTAAAGHTMWIDFDYLTA